GDGPQPDRQQRDPDLHASRHGCRAARGADHGADMVTSRQGRVEQVRLPTNAVADSQVKTGGADASAPAGLGVVFNVTTKVGANRLTGTAGVHRQNRRGNADNDPLGVPAIAESSEVEAPLGGPIRVDRVWFFASYFYLD